MNLLTSQLFKTPLNIYFTTITLKMLQMYLIYFVIPQLMRCCLTTRRDVSMTCTARQRLKTATMVEGEEAGALEDSTSISMTSSKDSMRLKHTTITDRGKRVRVVTEASNSALVAIITTEDSLTLVICLTMMRRTCTKISRGERVTITSAPLTLSSVVICLTVFSMMTMTLVVFKGSIISNIINNISNIITVCTLMNSSNIHTPETVSCFRSKIFLYSFYVYILIRSIFIVIKSLKS